MAPMGIRLSPLGMAVVGLLGLGVLYHLYSGILAGRFAFFMLGGGGGEEGEAAAAGSSEAAGGPPASGTVDLRELLAASVAAAARGGAEVRRVRDSNVLNEKAKGKTREGADEKMTSGDVLSNRKMYYLLKAAFPGVQINTEEHVDADDQEIIYWDRTIPEAIKNQIQPKLVQADSVTVWIDPLDATQEYTENLRQYVTTMVCAAVNGKPVIGVIHKPFSGYTAWAMVGGGSNIKPRSSYNEQTPTIIVSRSHEGKVRQLAWQTFGNKTAIIKAGGAGYKVLSLLDVPEKDQEKADVYIHVTYIKKWDICAGNAVLKALGGQMTTLAGEEISYTGSDGNEGGLIASINIDHRALVEKLPVLDKASQN
uniref:Golgi-resident adenosine 3',5'-bisphosphate 3'-phosphatase n=1 Tax=Podarcis muralis TaxID=64176 RepID=A0A670JM09_PODMU|nr:inositol monophosphatase 3 isoform X1 [Podarcis muralis]